MELDNAKIQKVAKDVWKAVKSNLEGRSGFDFMGDFDEEIDKEFNQDLINTIKETLQKKLK
jgi:hypothetical protein